MILLKRFGYQTKPNCKEIPHNNRPPLDISQSHTPSHQKIPKCIFRGDIFSGFDLKPKPSQKNVGKIPSNILRGALFLVGFTESKRML